MKNRLHVESPSSCLSDVQTYVTAIARQLSVIVGFFAADILWRITRPVGGQKRYLCFGERRFPKHADCKAQNQRRIQYIIQWSLTFCIFWYIFIILVSFWIETTQHHPTVWPPWPQMVFFHHPRAESLKASSLGTQQACHWGLNIRCRQMARSEWMRWRTGWEGDDISM